MEKKSYRVSLTSMQFSWLLATYFVLALNFSLILKLQSILSGATGLGTFFKLSLPILFINIFTLIFISLTRKHLAKILFVPLVIITAIFNYSSYKYGVIFSQDMIQNIFLTDFIEAKSYLNFSSFCWFIITAVVPSIFIIKVKIKYKAFWTEQAYKIGHALFCVLVIVILFFGYYKEYASILRNNPTLTKYIYPFYPLTNLVKYIYSSKFRTEIPYKNKGLDASKVNSGHKELLVIVVGETARASNYQEYGYSRKTNANTANLENFIFKAYIVV